MELKEFIISAISDISQAVYEADKEISGLGGMVNPGSHTSPLSSGQTASYVAPRTTLNFDVAVSATNSKAEAGGVKGKIWVIEASIEGEGTTKNESVSRLTFSIDVVLPHDKKQNERVGLVKSK
ncbi:MULTISPECIES: trypco2 family protein [unclassified Pannonibacter]|uniref:trypco2 family protein n=1 Tax=unclassified Pannonibacter TaxID=2627228 RepID=UPI0016442307|nr:MULTISPECIES: trypco2 family protein [unclassified Pannonibacter]